MCHLSDTACTVLFNLQESFGEKTPLGREVYTPTTGARSRSSKSRRVTREADDDAKTLLRPLSARQRAHMVASLAHMVAFYSRSSRS